MAKGKSYFSQLPVRNKVSILTGTYGVQGTAKKLGISKSSVYRIEAGKQSGKTIASKAARVEAGRRGYDISKAVKEGRAERIGQGKYQFLLRDGNPDVKVEPRTDGGGKGPFVAFSIESTASLLEDTGFVNVAEQRIDSNIFVEYIDEKGGFFHYYIGDTK